MLVWSYSRVGMVWIVQTIVCSGTAIVPVWFYYLHSDTIIVHLSLAELSEAVMKEMIIGFLNSQGRW